MKKVNSVWYIVFALTVWCLWNSIGCRLFVSTMNDVKTQQQALSVNVAYLIDRVQQLEEIEPQVIVKEVIKEVEIIKEVPVKIEELLEDTTNVQ